MTAVAPDAEFLEFQDAVAGQYSLERELGRGGMGIVYLAREVALDRLVAIKVLPPLLATRPELRERFLREARTAARLSHPHIVPIHRVGEAGPFVYFAMMYVEGETLTDRVRRTGPLPPAEGARILREVSWALAYAHAQGVIHRDVKPDNILLEAGSGRALVTDFGIAHVPASPAITGEGRVIGTAH
ncbi:MAG TPA: serine/threonine-protein kinase, partial [Gemmatimonadaceae bacterium]|nr:serine/threonine-protein kinase [Gemmatimonadaceae bacterium]